MKKQIQINISDKRLYAQIAFLVDNANFLIDIEKVRKEFKIDSVFQNPNFFEIASDEDLTKIRSFDPNRQSKTKQRIEFFKKVAGIRQKYKYPPYFDDAIIQAMLFNKIMSIKATQAVLHQASQPNVSHNLEMALFITPISTKKEVDAAYREATNLMKDYKNYHPISTKIKMKKGDLKDIERDRNWFWRNKNGEGSRQIAITDDRGKDYYLEVKKKMKYAGDLSDEDQKKYDKYLNNIDIYARMVQKAIDRYKANLSDV